MCLGIVWRSNAFFCVSYCFTEVWGNKDNLFYPRIPAFNLLNLIFVIVIIEKREKIKHILVTVTATELKTQEMHVNTKVTILAGVDIFLLVLAAFLNVIAALLQASTLKRHKLSNQSVLLIHLNGVAFINIIVNVWAVGIHGFGSTVGLSNRVFLVVYLTAHIAYCANLIFLTLDRLLYVLLKLKYRWGEFYFYFTKRQSVTRSHTLILKRRSASLCNDVFLIILVLT